MQQPIILAAGKGTRMRSDLPKVLLEVHGKPMLGWVIRAFEISHSTVLPLIVVGHQQELVRARYGYRATFVTQEQLTGTATAVDVALTAISPRVTSVVIAYGDQPFISSRTVRAIGDVLYLGGGATAAFGVVTVPNFIGANSPYANFGRIVRDAQQQPRRIVEVKHADPAQLRIRELNVGVCAFRVPWLKRVIGQIEPDPDSGERYLTTLLELAWAHGEKIALCAMNPEEALGINSQEDLSLV